DDAAPVRQHEVDALLGEGRHVGQRGGPLGAGDGQRLEGAGVDLLGVLAHAGDAGVDVVAEERGERLPTTGVGDVVQRAGDLRGGDAGLGEQLRGEDVVHPAGRAAGDRHRLPVGDDVVDEVLDRL